MKKLIFIFTLMLTFHVQAQSSCGTNCTYSIEGNVLTIKPIDATKEAYITSYNRSMDGTQEPDKHYAPWRFNEDITSVVIEQGVVSVGYSAFEDMRNITSVDLPEGLKTIGGESFNNTSITKVTIPSTVTEIGQYALATSSLKEINDLPEGLISIGAYAFSHTKITDFVIPSTVTTLAPTAFGSDADGWTRSGEVKNLYCSESLAEQCSKALQYKRNNGQEVSVISYQSTGDQIYYNGKFYQKPYDILSGNYVKKRIYTIDEATTVTGDVNRVTIRYK